MPTLGTRQLDEFGVTYIMQVCICICMGNFFWARFRAQFWIHFFETLQDGWYYEKLELNSFWTKSAQWEGGLGVIQIPQFRKMKAALLPILLELDKSINYNEKWCFSHFWPNWCLWDGVRGQNSSQNEGLQYFQRVVLSMDFDEIQQDVWNHNKWSWIKFQANRAIGRATGAKNATTKQY